MCGCSDLSLALVPNLTGLIDTTACEDNPLIASGDSRLGGVTAGLIAGQMGSYDYAGERKLNLNLKLVGLESRYLTLVGPGKVDSRIRKLKSLILSNIRLIDVTTVFDRKLKLAPGDLRSGIARGPVVLRRPKLLVTGLCIRCFLMSS